jgi:hypothetical protein
MARGKLVNIWTLLFVIVGTLVGFRAECSAYNWNKSLVGLNGLGVKVTFEPSQEQAEMRQKIEKDVERRLRMAGIKVFSVEGKPQEEQPPKLSVRIILHKPGAPIEGYVHGIEVQVLEKVSLVRESDAEVIATTWEAASVGTFGTSFGRLRSYVNEVVDGFVNAWLSVNPKRNDDQNL